MTYSTPQQAADYLHGYPDEFLKIPATLRPFVHALMDHARATTPGDDRGRELVRLSEAIDVVGVLLDNLSGTSQTSGHVRVVLRAATEHRARLRALAAPAETEAVAQPEGMCQECRGWVPLVLDLHRSDVEDPCGGSESVPACGARTDPGQVLCTKPIGHDNGVHAPATPPAQGPAEVGGLDPHRLGEALDYAWTQWIGDVGHVPDAFHLHPRTARCSATFEGSEFARHAAGRYDHLTRLAATPPAPEGEAGEDWRARYSALIGKVDEWVTEHHGDAAREDLIADLGVDGWLRVGWPPPAPADPQAEGSDPDA